MDHNLHISSVTPDKKEVPGLGIWAELLKAMDFIQVCDHGVHCPRSKVGPGLEAVLAAPLEERVGNADQVAVRVAERRIRDARYCNKKREGHVLYLGVVLEW